MSHRNGLAFPAFKIHMTALHGAMLLISPLASDGVFCYDYITIARHGIQPSLCTDTAALSADCHALAIRGVDPVLLTVKALILCITFNGANADGFCHAGFTVYGISNQIADAVFIVGRSQTLGFSIHSYIDWLSRHRRREVASVYSIDRR